MAPKSRSRVWYALTVTLAVFNAAGYVVVAPLGEPGHALAHAGAATLFGLLAWRIRRRRGAAALAAGDAERLEAIEAELSDQRRELADAHERLDFAERLLAQAAEERRLQQERR